MKRFQVCFGSKTALQLLRTIDPKEFSRVRRKAPSLPEFVPGRNELKAAVASLESSYSELNIERPVHIYAGSTSRCRSCELYKPHACSKGLSNKSLYQLKNGISLSKAALAFIQVAAQEKNPISLLELGYEMCGSYRTRRTGAPSAYQVPPLMTVRELCDYAERNPLLDGSRKTSRIMRYLADGSASPRETKQALILGLPMRYGGYGLGIPLMNYEIEANEAARVISQRGSFRCDLCWPEAKLDVEYQSREMHEGEISRIRDSRRTNALIAMGWTVVCITNNELDSLAATDAIAGTLSRLLGKRMRINVPDYHARKLKLRRQLGLSIGFES